MRVLFLIHEFPPERVGGTEIYTLGLAKALSARGHAIAVFHRAPDDKGLVESTLDGIRTFRAGVGPMTPLSVFRATFGNPQLSRAFAEAFNRFRPDVVHIQHLMGLPVYLADDIRHMGANYVLTLHDYWLRCANAQLLTNYDNKLCNGPRFGGVNCARCATARAGVPILGPFSTLFMPLFAARNLLLRRMMQHANILIAPSRFIERMARTWKVPTDRLVYIPHGIDSSGALAHTTFSEHARRFVYIGGISPQKGVHVLAHAWSRLERDAELSIYGDSSSFPDYRRQLIAISEQVQPPARINVFGRLDREDVWRVLSQTDGLLFPSVWYENAPVIIREAFAAGVPIIASRLGSIPEWVADQVDGILVEPGDVTSWVAALRRYIDEPWSAAKLAERIKPPDQIDEHTSRMESVYVQAIES